MERQLEVWSGSKESSKALVSTSYNCVNGTPVFHSVVFSCRDNNLSEGFNSTKKRG